MSTIGIIGLGNAGQRHARNALALGHDVVAYEPRAVEVCGVARVASVEQLVSLRPAAIIVATPPADHYAATVPCLDEGIPTLIEKPLETSYAHAVRLHELAEHYGARLAVGYQMRCLPSLIQFRDRVTPWQATGGVIGTIVNVDCLEAWPQATYRRDFLLEYSHELDTVSWLLGDRLEVMTYLQSPASWVLFVRTDSLDAHVAVVLSGIGERHRRGIEWWDDVEDVAWTFDPSENEAAYKAELELFLKGEPLSDGLGALRLVEAARRSAQSGKWELA